MQDSIIHYLFVDPNNTFVRAVLLALVSAGIGWVFAARGKLRWALPTQYVYNMPLPDGQRIVVYTRQVWVSNGGNAPLDEVEIVLNGKPQHFELWPPRTFETKGLEDGRVAILLANLAPRETVTLAILESNNSLPDIVTVRSKTDIGRLVRMAPMRIYSNWASGLAVAFMLFGIGSFIQFAISAAATLATSMAAVS